jgi:hypothetical protein
LKLGRFGRAAGALWLAAECPSVRPHRASRSVPKRPSIPTILWLIGGAFVLHEAEEWNLVSWLTANFDQRPEFSDRDARTLLVLFAFLGLSFTALCVRLLSSRGALLALLPLFVAVILGNALTHITWAVYFGGYAPGVATSIFLLVPLVLYLLARVVQERLAPLWFIVPLLVLAIIQPLGAALSGSTLSGPQQALQRFGSRLGAWLWGAA